MERPGAQEVCSVGFRPGLIRLNLALSLKPVLEFQEGTNLVSAFSVMGSR
jgi:hypothetical protein